MRYLLDKGVARRFVEGLGNFARGIRLTDEQQDAVAVLELADENALFMSDETWNLLMARRVPRWIISVISARVEHLVQLRYQRRWRRRLRQTFGFEREDAHQLALATFGSDTQGLILGVDVLVTFDKRLINRFYAHLPQIETKLHRMTSHLLLPYSQAILPELATPGEIPSTTLFV